MAVQDEVTIADSLRRSPVRVGLFVVGPILLAIAQLLNSAVAGLPFHVSVPFAALMVGYAVMFSRYHVARRRLELVERTAVRHAAD